MIPLPNPVKIIKEEKNKGSFEIEALYPGYGITLGNALRRVLLSSLEGGAVTQIKIKGVAHEFSTIDGVLEDVIQIMLNLKKLRFKVFSDEPVKATLKVKGEKEVKGKDLILPPQVELKNPEAHILTITDKKTEVEMELQIEKGTGYLARERRKKDRVPIGTILLDAIFSPVKRVAFRVENMRVGERTDYERLFLEIETDGTISPSEALKTACNILTTQLNFIANSLPEK